VRTSQADAPMSVHLASFPTADPDLIDDTLSQHVSLARRLVELGRAARAEAKVRTRQPLARALLGARGWESLDDELRGHIADELNVLELTTLADGGAGLVSHAAKANFRSLGKRFGKDTPRVASAVAAADAAALAAALAAGTASVVVDDLGEVELAPDDVIVTETPQEGWAVAREGETVALDLSVTAELTSLGLAREVVRAVQEARKSAGLEVTDRIHLALSADDETAAAIATHADMIAGEVLAVSLTDDLDQLSSATESSSDDGALTIRLRRAASDQLGR
jgi:isoleucyl-tRNA synthetase